MVERLIVGFINYHYKLTKITPAYKSGDRWIKAVPSRPQHTVGSMTELMLTQANCIERYPDESSIKQNNGLFVRRFVTILERQGGDTIK